MPTSYAEKLKDPRWQKKRLEILQRDNFTCSCCGDTKSSLHIHHFKYNGDPWDVDNSCLTTFCELCHFAHEFYDNFIIQKIIKKEKPKSTLLIIYCDNAILFSEILNNEVLNHVAFTVSEAESIFSEYINRFK